MRSPGNMAGTAQMKEVRQGLKRTSPTDCHVSLLLRLPSSSTRLFQAAPHKRTLAPHWHGQPRSCSLTKAAQLPRRAASVLAERARADKLLDPTRSGVACPPAAGTKAALGKVNSWLGDAVSCRRATLCFVHRGFFQPGPCQQAGRRCPHQSSGLCSASLPFTRPGKSRCASRPFLRRLQGNGRCSGRSAAGCAAMPRSVRLKDGAQRRGGAPGGTPRRGAAPGRAAQPGSSAARRRRSPSTVPGSWARQPTPHLPARRSQRTSPSPPTPWSSPVEVLLPEERVAGAFPRDPTTAAITLQAQQPQGNPASALMEVSPDSGAGTKPFWPFPEHLTYKTAACASPTAHPDLPQRGNTQPSPQQRGACRHFRAGHSAVAGMGHKRGDLWSPES